MDQVLPFLPAPECNIQQLFVVTLIYGYILFTAADMIGDGSELLLLVPEYATIVGSVVLPVLGAVPDGMMVLFSGLGNRQLAQTQVSVGVGALAGSTIMLLTISWYLGIYGGRVNLKNGQPNYSGRPKLNPNTPLALTGVKVGIKKNSKIMLVTTLLYLFGQIPALFFVPSKDTIEEMAREEIMSKNEPESESDLALTIMNIESSYVSLPSLAGLVGCMVFFCGYLYIQTVPDKAEEKVQQQILSDARMTAIQQGKVSLRGAMFGVTGDLNSNSNSGNDSSDPNKKSNTVLPGGGSSNKVRSEKEMAEICRPFFNKYDGDGNGKLSRLECSKIMHDLRENMDQDLEDELFKMVDVDNSGTLDFGEFVKLMLKYVNGETNLNPNMSLGSCRRKSAMAHGEGTNSQRPPGSKALSYTAGFTYSQHLNPNTASINSNSLSKPLLGNSTNNSSDNAITSSFLGRKKDERGVHGQQNQSMGQSQQLGGGTNTTSLNSAETIPENVDAEDDESDDEEEMPDDLRDLSPIEQQKAIKSRAFYTMGLGTILVLVFSDPMVDVLNEIGVRTGVPNFYISFVLAPLASNASELVATYKYAAKKTASSMVISLSTLAGAAIMNNTFCLAIFFALIYGQALVWSFSAEIIAIILVELIVGILALKEVQTMRDASFILALFPSSLIFVWVMNNIVGLP